MTSINKSFFKALLIFFLLNLGIGFSAFSSVQPSQLNNNANELTNNKTTGIATKFKAKPYLEQKLERELKMLTPGSKAFNPYFLDRLLSASKSAKANK